MVDRLGRQIEYLRLSVTQKCNLNCIYCRPESQAGTGSCSALSTDDFEAIVRVMVKLGVRKVRITGGEPLVRNDIVEIVQRVSSVPGITDLSMTTNGINLDSMAVKLKAAGLRRINISLDSLREDRYRDITRGGSIRSVIKGIRKSIQSGLEPVKINTVLIKGINDGEIGDFIKLTRDNPIEVRFIELMPIGEFGEKNTDKVVLNSEIIKSYKNLVPCTDNSTSRIASYYCIPGYKGRVGFISPMSHKFCSNCNRIRVTCDGKIRPCLGDNGERDLTDVLRNNPGGLEKFIEEAIYNKPEGHNFDKEYKSGRDMSMIGG